MEDKYLKKVHEFNIPLFTASEMIQEEDWLSEFFGYDSLKMIEKVLKTFRYVYQLFENGNRKFVAESAYEEAALADLRHEMEVLFYQVKDDFPGKEVLERGALSDSMHILISIFICIPTIMSDHAKEDILNYTIEKNLLSN